MAALEVDPDYQAYTFSQLLEARSFIDSSKYPSRTRVLDEEIARRAAQPQAKPARLPQRYGKWITLDLTNKGIGLYLLIAGTISLASLVNVLFGADKLPPLFPFTALPALSYTAMVVGGVLLVSRQRAGIEVSIAALLLQAPVLQVGRLTYVLTSIPGLELKIWPELGVFIGTSGTLNFVWHQSEQAFYLGVNMAAVIVLALLLERLDRRIKAAARMRRSRGDAAG